ncbi:14419_t:CDS:2, partial [Gigaspora margarita]
MIMLILSEQHSKVLKRDAEIAEFLGIEKPKTVFVICIAIKTFNWIQYQQAVNRGEKIKEKDLMPKYIKNIEIEKLISESKKIEEKGVEKSELKPTYTNSKNQSEQKTEADYTGQDFKTKKKQAIVEFEKLENKEKEIQQKSKSDNNKEDGPSSYIIEKKRKKNKREKGKEKETEPKNGGPRLLLMGALVEMYAKELVPTENSSIFMQAKVKNRMEGPVQEQK